MEEIVLIERRLKESGSRRELSPALVKVRVVPPFKARSRLEGMSWRRSSSSKFCFAVGVWGSAV